MDRISEATKMVEAFISAGAYAFDTLRTTIDKWCISGGYGPAQSPHQLRGRLPYLMAASLLDQTNLIIRPSIRPTAGLLQLDDLNAEMLDRVRPLAFLVIATSTERRQAWVAVEGCDRQFCRRVKQAAGADMGANGWVRLAGSLNIKPKNSPNFPTVRVEEVQRCAKASPADFHALELAAPAEPSTGSYRAAQPVNGKRPRAFPSYERCLKGAPSAAAGEKDRSLADFTWCCIAIRWGWFPEEAAAQLIKEPLSKAHVRGEQYAMYTAMKAAAAVAGAPPRA